jgi:CcmD family protein
MSWLIAAYAAVAIAVGIYVARLATLRRGLDAESKRRR